MDSGFWFLAETCLHPATLLPQDQAALVLRSSDSFAFVSTPPSDRGRFLIQGVIEAPIVRKPAKHYVF